MWLYPETPLDETEAMFIAYVNSITAMGAAAQERILRGSILDRDIAILGVWHYAVIYLLAEYAEIPLKDWCEQSPQDVLEYLFSHSSITSLISGFDHSVNMNAPYTEVIAPLLHKGRHRPEWVWRIVNEIYTVYIYQPEEQEQPSNSNFQSYCRKAPLPGRDRVIALYGNIDLQGNPWVLQTRYEASLRPDENPAFSEGDTADIVTRIVPLTFTR